MPNPYEPIDSSATKLSVRWNRNAVIAFVFGALALLLATPGLFLFNQDYLQLIPTTSGITSFEFNGTSVSNQSVMAYSFASAGGLVGASLYFAACAFRDRLKHIR